MKYCTMEKQVKHCTIEKQMKAKVCCFVSVSLKPRKQLFADVLQNGVRKNLAIFTGKHLCWSLFLMKFRLFKRDSNTSVFLSILQNF